MAEEGLIFSAPDLDTPLQRIILNFSFTIQPKAYFEKVPNCILSEKNSYTIVIKMSSDQQICIIKIKMI